MRVGVLGASGFIGRYVCTALEARGDEVVAASLRDPVKAARGTAACDAIVNLAGEPIAQRWNEAMKRRLFESRVDAPKRYLDSLAALGSRSTAYVSASAIGYYGTSETQTFDETNPHGDDFLGMMCAAWEAQAHAAAQLGMHVSIVRTGVVLATDGGALAKMLPPFKLGLGGKIGSGRQWISWIHIADLVEIYLTSIDGAAGTFNGTAPHPVTNAELTHELARALHRPAFFPTPVFALRAFLGEGAEILTTGQRVVPKHTLERGFTFAYPTLAEALSALLTRHPEEA